MVRVTRPMLLMLIQILNALLKGDWMIDDRQWCLRGQRYIVALPIAPQMCSSHLDVDLDNWQHILGGMYGVGDGFVRAVVNAAAVVGDEFGQRAGLGEYPEYISQDRLLNVLASSFDGMKVDKDSQVICSVENGCLEVKVGGSRCRPLEVKNGLNTKEVLEGVDRQFDAAMHALSQAGGMSYVPIGGSADGQSASQRDESALFKALSRMKFAAPWLAQAIKRLKC